MIDAVVGEVIRGMENAADMNIKVVDDYMDADTGLLMCGKCHTKKQKKIAFLGEERIVGCLCRCAAEKLEKEREEYRVKEELLNIQKMKSAGLQDRTFYNYTFDRCDALQENAVYAKRYVEHFSEMVQTGQGLLFWGNVGTGKTFLAGCIANALLEQKIPVLMTSFPKILNALGGLYSSERNEYLASLNRYTLLVIDDMGIERESQYTVETIYTVIDERYKSGKPFIITTNIQLDALKSPQEVEHARIYDRIMERCMPVFFGGKNYRSELGQGNRDTAKKILTGVKDTV